MHIFHIFGFYIIFWKMSFLVHILTYLGEKIAYIGEIDIDLMLNASENAIVRK